MPMIHGSVVDNFRLMPQRFNQSLRCQRLQERAGVKDLMKRKDADFHNIFELQLKHLAKKPNSVVPSTGLATGASW